MSNYSVSRFTKHVDIELTEITDRRTSQHNMPRLCLLAELARSVELPPTSESFQPSASRSGSSPCTPPTPSAPSNTGKIIPAHVLSQTAFAQVQWRFHMFYAPFFSTSKQGALLASTLESIATALEKYDWQATWATLQAERKAQQQRSLFARKGARVGMLKAIQAASASTSLPERQIEKAIEAYAHFDRVRNLNARSTPSPGRSRSRDPKLQNARRLAEQKDWQKLARALLDDFEDLEKCMPHFHLRQRPMSSDEALTGQALGQGTSIDKALSTAMKNCRKRYFSYLERQRHAKYCYGFLGCHTMDARIVFKLSEREHQSLDGQLRLEKEMRAMESVRRSPPSNAVPERPSLNPVRDTHREIKRTVWPRKLKRGREQQKGLERMDTVAEEEEQEDGSTGEESGPEARQSPASFSASPASKVQKHDNKEEMYLGKIQLPQVPWVPEDLSEYSIPCLQTWSAPTSTSSSRSSSSTCAEEYERKKGSIESAKTI